MPVYNYTRIRPLDLLQVASDQGANVTLSAAIAAIQTHNGQTHDCPQCVDQNNNPTGWITIPISNGTAQVICTICDGNLKTTNQWMPDPNNQGKFITLNINGAGALVANNTLQYSSNVANGQWTSSNPDAATININTGLASGVAAGNTTITYTVGNYNTSIQLVVTAQ